MATRSILPQNPDNSLPDRIKGEQKGCGEKNAQPGEENDLRHILQSFTPSLIGCFNRQEGEDATGHERYNSGNGDLVDHGLLRLVQ